MSEKISGSGDKKEIEFKIFVEELLAKSLGLTNAPCALKMCDIK